MFKSSSFLFAAMSAVLVLAGCAKSPSRTTPVAAAPASASGGSAKTDTASKTPAPVSADGWRSLFDGKSLKGWKETDFSGRGPVIVTNGEIVLRTGYMTGITWSNTADLIRMNYELSVEAKRADGSDFFCGLTFPVSTNACTLIVGGWGGSLVGLSSLDGEDAANNETTKSMEFKQNQWYHIRVEVRPDKIKAWIDDEKLIDVITTERRIGVRMEVEECVPLGVATWSTTGVLRNFRVRPLPEAEK